MNKDNLREGYIKLFRSLQDNPLWLEKRAFSRLEAWLDILFEARWKEEPEEVLIGNKVFTCHRGEVLYSLETWMRRWNWKSKKRVKGFLKGLEKGHQLETHSVAATTRLFVVNYKEYQDYGNAKETPEGTPGKREGNAKDPQQKKEEVRSKNEERNRDLPLRESPDFTKQNTLLSNVSKRQKLPPSTDVFVPSQVIKVILNLFQDYLVERGLNVAAKKISYTRDGKVLNRYIEAFESERGAFGFKQWIGIMFFLRWHINSLDYQFNPQSIAKFTGLYTEKLLNAARQHWREVVNQYPQFDNLLETYCADDDGHLKPEYRTCQATGCKGRDGDDGRERESDDG